ncbi:MAG: hypothetical protein U0163_01755 [Gemmatimonadaceae bacterium]
MKDPRLQSQQQVEEQRDKTYSYKPSIAWRRSRFSGSPATRSATSRSASDRFGIGSDRRAYEQQDNIDGGQHRRVPD